MPVTDYQGSTSSPFSFGRSLLSLRRDTTTAIMPSGEEADVEAFQRHVASTLAELLPAADAGAGDAAAAEAGEEFLSAAWIRHLPVTRSAACNAARDGVDQVHRW